MSPSALTHVSANAPLIERCAYRMFAASAQTPTDGRRQARFRAAAVEPRRIEPGNRHGAPVPFAVALWLSYLLWLEATLYLFTPRALHDVTAAEAAGLHALTRARARFTAEHTFCPQCEAPNPGGATRCRRCSREF